MKETSVAILMATYNGAPYVGEQIESLQAQTYREWDLYIHDDGSTDGTPDIIGRYAQQDSRIHLLHYPPTHAAKDNFFSLLEHVEADYYLLCDQDDQWVPDKVAWEMERMSQVEQDPQRPVIVYSDLMVVDANLRKIADSFMDYSGYHPEFLTTFDELGASCLVTGCTMLLNNAARRAIHHPTTPAVMHDAWITLCTLKHGGTLSYIPAPLVRYRQHGRNTLGATDIQQRRTWAYKLRNLASILRDNRDQYRMLRALGYGSIAKYVYYKAKYKYRITVSSRPRQTR